MQTRGRGRWGKHTAVSAGQGYRLVDDTLPLDVLAPFHVVEEECFVAILVVQLTERYRTAAVEPKLIESELRFWLTCSVGEVVASIQPVIPSEPPRLSVKLLR